MTRRDGFGFGRNAARLDLGIVGVEVADFANACPGNEEVEAGPMDPDGPVCKRGKVGFLLTRLVSAAGGALGVRELERRSGAGDETIFSLGDCPREFAFASRENKAAGSSAAGTYTKLSISPNKRK